MTDQEVWQLIFAAGFSTAEVITDVSGRGVGMDVVKRNIQALGGSVEIDSAPGAGTRMSIRLPLTLAILDGLSVRVGEQTFIIPLNHIVESLQPAADDVKTVRNQDKVIHVRGEYLPVLASHEIFNIAPQPADAGKGIMVILESEGAKKALYVDELVGQHQVVIKSLETNYRRVRGISGATIMGDGRVALIVDVGMLVRGLKPALRVAA
jgi:two-component system chemotaxis sensor kinase CheA